MEIASVGKKIIAVPGLLGKKIFGYNERFGAPEAVYDGDENITPYDYDYNTLENRLEAACDVKKNWFDAEMIADAAALCAYVYWISDSRKTKDKIFKTKSGEWHLVEGSESGTGEIGKFVDNLKNSRSNLGNRGILGGTVLRFTHFNVFGRLSCAGTGFYSKIFYKERNGQITDIAYVTEGSITKGDLSINYGLDILGDWVLANTSQGLTSISPQYTRSIQNAKAIYSTIKLCGNVKLWFFGHSLGGGLAVANARACPDAKAITFNAAGLNHIRKVRDIVATKNFFHISKWKETYSAASNVLSCYTEHDILSNEKNGGIAKLLKLMFLYPDGIRFCLGKGGHGMIFICEKLRLRPCENEADFS